MGDDMEQTLEAIANAFETYRQSGDAARAAIEQAQGGANRQPLTIVIHNHYYPPPPNPIKPDS